MFLILCAAVLKSCTTTGTFVKGSLNEWELETPPPSDSIAVRAFLVGNAGKASSIGVSPTLSLLQSQLDSATPNDVVVFLGDNVHCCGLRTTDDRLRYRDEAALEAQLSAVADFPGRTFFIPGDRDWNGGSAGGLDAVRRQERFVEERLGYNAFLPNNGFPGPAEVELTDFFTLVALDTQWWLHAEEKAYGETEDYELEEDVDFLWQIDDVIKRNDDDVLLFVGHHPVESVGAHGGEVPTREHLFPLRNLHPALWIPLPIVGSLYPLATRRFFAGRQDLGHSRYRALRKGLRRTFAQHENLIYAAAHDRSLQYFHSLEHPVHYIVSGAGSDPTPVGNVGRSSFAHGNWGYSVLNVYIDGTVWLEMWEPSDDGSSGEMLLRTRMKGPNRELVDPQIPESPLTIDYSDSTVVAAINPELAANGAKAFFLGSHHRDLWATPIEADVLDIGTKAGGLQPVKRGGGQQTTSLRLEDSIGMEYVLRSIDKDASRSLPEQWQGTVADDIVDDQIASLHPFGALIVPPLAKSAGVYHTNPEYFYVPDDPRFGIYRELFANRVMMLEERPDDDMSEWPSSGNSSDVRSAAQLYEAINEDNDHRVDQAFYARTRLFDMWIGDWDRHRDQWRWASFEPVELDSSLTGDDRTNGKIYRPIPRDRDWAFFRMNGLFPTLIKQKYFFPKFQDFRKDYGYVRGILTNGLSQDRRFMNQLTRQELAAIADSLQSSLTDESIERAVREWPTEIYEKNGHETIELLKIRRDKLPELVDDVYEILADVVDVVGSDDHELFEIVRMPNGATRVVVFNADKEGNKRNVVYERLFDPAETKEIRCYGLDGDDRFEVTGDANHAIDVILVGGPGEDAFVDRSSIHGLIRNTTIFDNETGTTVDLGREAKTILDDTDPTINEYNAGGYRYGQNLPLLFLGYNDDDGAFLGGGVRLIRHAFRANPYAARHDLKANFATNTTAVNLVYKGEFVDVVQNWSVSLSASYRSRESIRNFYGLGNTTRNNSTDRSFYQARLSQAQLKPALFARSVLGARISVGPTLEFTDVREEADRFLAIQPGISENTFRQQLFGGLEATFEVESLRSVVNPLHGYNWSTTADVNVGLRSSKDNFTMLASTIRLYASPLLSPQVTIAIQAGVAHNIGDFPFFRANTLGGGANLRGYRSTRFAGRTAFFQNLEVRMELTRFRSAIAIGKAGVYGFIDNGRVWTEADDRGAVSQSLFRGYHQGFGGGAWAALFDQVVFRAGVGLSSDDRTFTAGLGFHY